VIVNPSENVILMCLSFFNTIEIYLDRRIFVSIELVPSVDLSYVRALSDGWKFVISRLASSAINQ
jgi:hypothetical protein